MWGCLTVAGLLLAGCSFEHGGGASSPDPAADAGGGGFSDGLPHPDGGAATPDGAPPDGAPAIEPVLLDTLTIDVTSAAQVQSAVVLLSGQAYQLIASGEAVVRDDDAGRYRGDADYWYGSIFGGDGFGGVDYGLAIDDTVIDGDRSPDWGEFADSHVYQATVTGTGAPITAQYHDSNYGNGNSGSLTLEIWGPPP